MYCCAYNMLSNVPIAMATDMATAMAIVIATATAIAIATAKAIAMAIAMAITMANVMTRVVLILPSAGAQCTVSNNRYISSQIDSSTRLLVLSRWRHF